ncbi:MAG: aldo/keto reductase [Patescibacteria group bacterium]
MHIPTKKLLNGFEMPVYGLGTWQMGGRFERDENNDDAADIQAIKNAIDHGVTHIDTAERYASGFAEILVGKAIKGLNRKNLFLVSKVAKANLNYDTLINSAKASLNRLGTEYFDLYLIHNPSLEIPLEETMSAMDFLVEKGLTRYIGVSNFTPERLGEAQKYSRNKIVANQVHYNLMVREPERKGLLRYCQENDVMLIAWRPLQKGIISASSEKIVQELSKKYSKTPAQLAINWLISQPNVVTLSKTTNIDHLEENLGALGWNISEEDVQRLRKEFPNQSDTSDAVSLQ